MTFAASLREGKVYNDCHGFSIRVLLELGSRAYLIGEHQSVPFPISGRRQLALARRIVHAAVIAVLRQQPRDVGHDERDGTKAFWGGGDLGFSMTRVRTREESPNARRLIPPSLLLGQRSVMPVAPTPWEEIPEAQPQRTREAEA